MIRTNPTVFALTVFAAVWVPSLLRAQGESPWNAMDYGPYQLTTVSAADPENLTHKGLAIKIPVAEGSSAASLLFDTELLRVSATWTGGWLNLRGTPYDGGHGSWCGIRGREVTATPRLPGWSRSSRFVDPRPIPHGSLPRAHGRYRGLWLAGPRVTVGYEVFGTPVLESSAEIKGASSVRAIARDLDLGKTDEPLFLMVHEGAFGDAVVDGGRLTLVDAALEPSFVTRERVEGGWSELRCGNPSARDTADRARGNGIRMTQVNGYARARGAVGEGGDLSALHDGKVAQNSDDLKNNVWFDRDGQAQKGRILIDLREMRDVRRFHVYSWHRAERAAQNWRLFASDAPERPDPTPRNLAKSGWRRVAAASTGELGQAGKHAVAIARTDGSSIAKARWMLLETEPKGTANGTFLSEIDVWTERDVAAWKPNVVAPSVTGLAILGDTEGLEWQVDGAKHRAVLRLDPAPSRKLRIVAWRGPKKSLGAFDALVQTSKAHDGLEQYTEGGPRRWPEVLETAGKTGREDGSPWIVDTITTPPNNPWKSRLRFGAFDLFADGKSAALCTWNGDVWIVDGIDDGLKNLRWSRYATGLFEPLGLLIVDDKVMVHGRDGVTRLHDLDDDGEADFYECFNNDVYVTKGFHEFAFDLQRGPKGNFFMSKGGPVNAGGRGFMKITPHAGTILELSADGEELSVYATGLRAPNGIGMGPNGEITSGDNEGTWMPRCRLNWIERGSFNGCVPLAHREVPPTEYDPPLCWLPFAVDNSSGGQVWVPDDRWGPMKGELLHLSYGQCRVYRVLKEEVDGVMQGGITAMPLSFASSCMRARFSEADGQLYIVGFKGWQTRAVKDTAFQRVRRGKGAVRMPSALHVRPNGIELEFSCELDPETANDPESYSVQIWNYLWTSKYGSPEVSVKDPSKVDKNTGSYNREAKNPQARDSLEVRSARLLDGGTRVFLEIPEIAPVMQMEIAFNLDAKDGEQMRGKIWNSIHKIPSK